MIRIWSKEQYQHLTKKFKTFVLSLPCCPDGAPRWIEILLQVSLIVILEIIPILIGVMVFFVNPTTEDSGFLSNISYAFQYFLTSGFSFCFVFIFIWWIGSLIENWKRLFMFLTGKMSFFEKLKTREYKQSKKVATHSFSNLPNYGAVSEKFISDQDSNTGRGRSSSSVSMKSKDSASEDVIDFADSSPQEIVSENVENDLVEISKDDANQKTYEIEKEKNVWVLLTWYCCLSGIAFPTPKALFYKIKKSIFKKNRDQDDKEKRRMYLKMSYVWSTIVLSLLVLGVCLLGIFRVKQVFLIVLVLVICIITNIILERYVFIPPHAPSKERLLSCWIYNNENPSCWRFIGWLDKYITFIEEVFYHSPHVMYKASKFMFYTLTIIIAVCITFKFTETYLTFFFPWSFCLIATILQIWRFNMYRWWDKFMICIGRTAFTSEQSSISDSDIGPLVTGEGEEVVNNPRKVSSLTQNHLDNRSKKYKNNTPPHYHTPHESTFLRYLTVLYIQLTIFISLMLIIGFTFFFIGWISGLCLIILLFMISFILFMRVDVNASETLFACFVTFLFLLGAIFILGGLNASAGSDDFYWSQVNYKVPNNETTLKFDICSNKWFGYTIVDYALLSALAYEIDPFFSHDLKTWFPECANGGCVVVRRENATIDFFDLYIPEKNLSIISVRGTTIPRDVVQDVDVWKEAGLLQLATILGPFAVWPRSLLVDLVYYVAQIEQLTMVQSSNTTIDQSRYYYEVLEDYVIETKKQRNVILTGHSLGGGLSKIVGSRNGVDAVTFSGPGVMLSRKKFDLTEESINRHCVSVKPAIDLVPQIDIDGGLVQHIDCHGTIVTCHAIVHTTRKLIGSCGDYPLNRWIKSYTNVTNT